MFNTYSGIMKTTQCTHATDHQNGFAAKSRLWTAMTLLYILCYDDPCFMLVEHSLRYEPISVLIYVYV